MILPRIVGSTSNLLGAFSCVIGLLVSGCAVCANWKRQLNWYVASFLLFMAAAQFMQLLAIGNPAGLMDFRFAHSLGGWVIVSGILIQDAIIAPSDGVLGRIRRQWRLIAGGMFLIFAPMMPKWIPYHSIHKLLVDRDNWYFFVIYFSIRTLLVIFLAVIAIKNIMKVEGSGVFDAHVFCVLWIFGVAELTISLVLRLGHWFNAVGWTTAAIQILFPITGWMIISERTYSVREMLQGIVEAAAGMGCLLLLLFFLINSTTLGRWSTGFVVMAGVYPAFWISDWLCNCLGGIMPDTAQRRLRQSTLRALEMEWNLNGLLVDFSKGVGEFLGGPEVELCFLDDRLTGLDPDTRLLTRAALDRGWISARLVPRRFGDIRVSELQRAFARRRLSWVIALPDDSTVTVLFIGEMATLKVMTCQMIALIQELMVLVRAGRNRILLARKAIHNERLITAGFIASQVSHDARNSLDAIRVAIEVLGQGREAELSVEHRHLLLRELDAFLFDFDVALDMARSDMGEIEVSSATNIVEEAITIFSSYTKSRGISVATQYGHTCCEILADRRLLKQTLFNLIRNASEALSGQSDRRIIVRTTNSASEFHIEVEDNGPGISDEFYDRMFIEFATTKASGTGLGLALCREAMSLMRGSICYVTPRGHPSACFRLTVPLAIRGFKGMATLPLQSIGSFA